MFIRFSWCVANILSHITSLTTIVEKTKVIIDKVVTHSIKKTDNVNATTVDVCDEGIHAQRNKDFRLNFFSYKVSIIVLIIWAEIVASNVDKIILFDINSNIIF